jgi:hypothetical protein
LQKQNDTPGFSEVDMTIKILPATPSQPEAGPSGLSKRRTTPDQIVPLPKAPQRKSGRKRLRLKSAVITATPEKDRIAALHSKKNS